MDTLWYESFFKGIVLDMWRQVFPPEQTRLEADFLTRALGLSRGAKVLRGARVLDVPCGLGRHAIELASRGFAVTGVDLSEEAIGRARGSASAAALEVEWRHSDMRDLPWRDRFDAGYCIGNSFAYLPPEGNREFIRAVSRALKPGARFVLDSGAVAESVLPNLKERESAQVGDILFEEDSRYLVPESCVETTYTFTRGTETFSKAGLHWVYTVREICALLDEEGLTVEGLYRSLQEEPFTVGSPYLVLVARKG